MTKAASNTSGRCFWSNQLFADRLHYSLSKVKRGFNELEAAEFMAIQGGQGKSLRKFHFLMPLPASAQQHAPDDDGPPEEGVVPAAPPSEAAGGASKSSAAEPVPAAVPGAQTPTASLSNAAPSGAENGDVHHLETVTSDHFESVRYDPIGTRSEPFQKGHFRPSKGSELTLSYIIPNKFQNTRERAREAQTACSAACGKAGLPRKPALNLASIAHYGSERERAWNDWLGRHGFPPLSELRIKSSDAQGRGWEIPYRYPPTDQNAFEHRIVHLWAEWAMATMEARHG